MYTFRAISMFFAMFAVVASFIPLMQNSADNETFAWFREGAQVAYADKRTPAPKTMYAYNDGATVALIEPAAGDEDGVEILINFDDKTAGQ